MSQIAQRGTCPKCGERRILHLDLIWEHSTLGERYLTRIDVGCAACGFQRRIRAFGIPDSVIESAAYN